jgi:hypothetical protein
MAIQRNKIDLQKTAPEETEASDLLDKDFLNCFKYAQRARGKHKGELKEIMKMIFEQNENVNTDI